MSSEASKIRPSVSPPYSTTQAIRIINLDSSMSCPIQGLDVMYSEFRGSSVSQVPTLRVFGSIPTGEKICVHVHGVFPYIYIPYDGIEDANALMYKIAACIDKAVNISLNQAMSTMQHVYKITLVSGIPMYGYHPKEHQFFKIHLYNPLLVRKVTTLLMNETTLGNLYQPHEAHLPFALQFMMDYNLHGMSNMNVSKIKYRHDSDSTSTDINVDSELFLPRTVTRLTVCQLEGDCLAEDIVNRLEIASGNIAANPGIAALWEDEQQRRRNKGMDSQIEHLLELKMADLPPTNSHLIYKQALRDRLVVFSNKKNVVDKLSTSVYPAETPDYTNVQNASVIDSQTPISSDDTFLISSNDLNQTIVPAESSSINISLDQDVQQLYKVLNELEENSKEKEMEEDSILTHVLEENEQDKDVEENELDFSMSLEGAISPTKFVPERHDSGESDDDLLNTTLIPQIDGSCDESIKELRSHNLLVKNKTKRNKSVGLRSSKRISKLLHVKIVTVERGMPDLDSDVKIKTCTNKTSKVPAVLPKPNLKTDVKKPTAKVTNKHKRLGRLLKLIWKQKKEKIIKKTLLEVKTFENRIKKLKRQDQLATIIRKLHVKENRLILFLTKRGQPKFRVISKDRVEALHPKKVVDRNKTSHVNILNDIITKIENFVDPILHVIVKCPSHCCYLYNYSSQLLPTVTRIPRKICQSYNKTDMLNYVKEQVLEMNSSTEGKCKIADVRIEDNKERLFSATDFYENSEMENKIDFEQEKTGEATFSEKDWCNAKDSTLAEKVHSKTYQELVNMADKLKQQLQTHLDILKSLDIRKEEDVTFTNEQDRLKFLNNINCLKSETEEHNSNNINNEHLWIGSNKDSDINEFGIDGEICQKFNYKDGNFDMEYKNGSDPIDETWKNKKLGSKFHGIAKSKHPLSLDGAFDSESSSEDEGHMRKLERRSKTPRIESRYKALPISVQKSPKSVKSSEPAVNDLVLHAETCQKTSLQIGNKNSVCDANVKRQLFENEPEPALQSTIIEEKLVCRYSSNQTVRLLKNAISNLNDECNNQKFHEESSTDTTTSHSNTIFSTDSDNLETSFFASEIKYIRTLTTAEKYDKDKNYEAKEGCSKFLTPQDAQTASQDRLNSSGGSSSDLITPYQQNRIQPLHNLTTVFEENGDEPLNDTPNTKNTASITLVPKIKAPARADVLKFLDLHKLPRVKSEEPFYSNTEDVTGSMEVGFNVLKINSKSTAHLSEFESQTDSLNSFRISALEQLSSSIKLTKNNTNNVILSHCSNRYCIITPVKKPPSLKVVENWIQQKYKITNVPENRKEKIKIHVPLSPGAKSDDEIDLSLTLSPLSPHNSQSSQGAPESTPKVSKSSGTPSPTFRENYKKRKKEIRDRVLTRSARKSLAFSQDRSVNYSGQITGVTVNNSLDYTAQNLQNARAIIEHQNVTVMVMELHIRTRGDYKPDPTFDSIRAIFYSILHDVPEPNLKGSSRKGVIVVNNEPLSPGSSTVPILNGVGIDCDITYVNSENNLINQFIKLVNYWDPDIFAGYEVELLSWGYLIQRGYILNMNLKPLLGRIKDIYIKKQKNEQTSSELRLVGRIVLDVWRLMRHEIAIQSYTFESIAYHILHKRFPSYSFKDLSFWWDHRSQLYRHKTVKYYIIRVVTVLELFDKLDFLGRTSELARLFGIQFFEVLSRGSQFRVESMMLRLAKPLNFIAVSPSVQQRAHMKAPEYIPLVMEPESKLYTDPVIVLDFQSLYPSIIIAYNYCFTTCVGQVECLGKSGAFQFAATQLKVSRSRLKKLLERNLLNFSPCGAGFVKKEVRDGIIPRMLREILDTRLMVKNSMKENRDDKVLQKVLHNRQLGLKLIANVTYGYTAANFSGRMPAVEIADSVVSKGRETLQRAIELVDNTPEWGARVVYGDTDSLFVLVPGRTKDHAFSIGQKIADAVSNDNPDPIKLKLEKVYQPCILQTKKRYVGYMYENPDQEEPVYQAKGIETVRRDGCPAVSKMLEKCLRILFETKDVTLVKNYVLKQFNKIIAGRVSIQDLTFAKEYRGAAGYRPGACVPALELTKKWTAVDVRNEPRSGERVPYVIVNGPPGLPLIRLVRSPRDLIKDNSLKPNSQYYIMKVIIPPINRCFTLLGADLKIWFNQMPRRKTQYLPGSMSPKKKSTISQYFSTSSCASCDEQTQTGICQDCQSQPQNTVITLMEKMRTWERNYHQTLMVCQTCTSSVAEVKCDSLDCPVYYRRIQTGRDEQQTIYIRQLLSINDLLY